MILIIAEKPSLARTVAKALGKYEDHTEKDHTGFLKINNYIISWAFGHILELNSIYDYLNNNEIKWKDIPLPFIPSNFTYKLKNDPGIKKQFKVLNKLINESEYIIHCGDADREGQLIIDNILNEVSTTKEVKRLWLPEQTEQTIRSQINLVKSNKEYLNLHNEGIARSYLDWLLGINLTVYLTVKSGQKLAVGRVLIPIIKFIYDRDIEIRNFKEQLYYQVEGSFEKDGIKATLTDKRKEDEKEKADLIAKTLSGKVKVIKIEKKEIKKQPGKLFSLSTLQSFLSTNYKIDFSSSIKTIQKLYEQGYITYPRTNTEYLAETEKEKVKELLNSFSEYSLEFKDSKKIFDSSKIESHSAIIPTRKISKDLLDDEKLIYEVIRNRFIINFLKEDTKTAKTTITIQSLNDESITFELNGETIIQEGFYKYEPKEFSNNLPLLAENEEFDIIFDSIQKKTQPKKKVTEEELSNYLKNPFKVELKDNDNDDDEYKNILNGLEIGTVATRTGIIANAIKYGYISQKKSNYTIEPLGEKLIEILEKLKINLYKEKSVEFGKALKQVYKNEITTETIIENAKKELIEIFNKNIEIEKVTSSLKESFGKCPVCKKDIYKGNTKTGKTTYYCSGYKDGCSFVLYSEMKHFTNILKISDSKAKKLIEGKEVLFKLKSSKGNEYEAYLKLKMNGKYVNFEQTRFKEKKGGDN